MAHRAKIMPWRTFRFNLCACNPYNADFDGDEMNMHLPQTHEARAEAAHLMIVHNNFVTPKHGEPLVVPLQDFLTAMYLITNKDVFVDRSRFAQLCCMVNDANERVEMPPPAILKPVRLWTGKQVVSILLRPNRAAHWPRLNLECASRQYPKRGAQGRVPCMDALDRFVVFRHGVHICGNLDKKILGSSKTGMFLRLIRDHSAMHAARVMNRLSKLCARWLGERGFSIGISDVTPSEELTVLKEEMLRDGYDKCDEFVGEFELGKMIPQPGCTKLETLEAKMLGLLSGIREKAGQSCLSTLPYFDNSPNVMAICGSKGSTINIAQMIACVGQQALQGARIPEGFVDRTLPHFPVHSRTPRAKGFVENSFFTGLTATEFFFHTMAGREGLVDTAVKT
eukprot:60062_1